MLTINTQVAADKADIGLTDEGHILIRIHENKEIDLPDIQEINAIKNKLAENKMYTVVFVAPFFGNITKEAREFSASKQVYDNAIAKGIVVKNFAARLIGSFFIKVNKPPALTRIFETEIEAAEWLTKVREKHFSEKQIS
jgi:hypothetical protein